MTGWATPAEKADPGFEPTPRYWVPEREVGDRLAAKGWTRGWLMGWRDITGVEKIRTVIASVLPRVAAGHTYPLIFVDKKSELRAALLELADARFFCPPQGRRYALDPRLPQAISNPWPRCLHRRRLYLQDRQQR